jgi:hypothetical protein
MAARICTLALAGAIALFAVPGLAQAKPGCGGTTTTPGTSEVDQYTETVPGACGDQPNGGGGGGGSGSPSDGGESGDAGSSVGGPIPPSTVDQLESLGSDGAAAAALAEANSPEPDTAGTPGADAGSGQAGSSDGSSLTPIIGAFTGSDGNGMGALLPAILIAVAAGGIAVAVRRRANQAS